MILDQLRFALCDTLREFVEGHEWQITFRDLSCGQRAKLLAGPWPVRPHFLGHGEFAFPRKGRTKELRFFYEGAVVQVGAVCLERDGIPVVRKNVEYVMDKDTIVLDMPWRLSISFNEGGAITTT